MPTMNVRTSKPAQKAKTHFALFTVQNPSCRRCGAEACICSEEELANGGPARL